MPAATERHSHVSHQHHHGDQQQQHHHRDNMTDSPSSDHSAHASDIFDLHHVRKLQRSKSHNDGSDICRVCGDGHARMHYGVLTCFGCKGFFRRTLKRPTEYTCRHNGTCIVDRHERNSCRYCRFKKCLEVGMDPKAVRPDRDATGRHYQSRNRRIRSGDAAGANSQTQNGTANSSHPTANNPLEDQVDDDWSRKLPVDMRTTLMQLMNIDLMVNRGDIHRGDPHDIFPLPFTSLRQILDDPTLLDGRRTEMRYEAYRQVRQEELSALAHRRLIAIIDWIDHLFDIMDLHRVEDKVALVKSGYAPLTIFTFSAGTAQATKNKDTLCLCNYGYVPRNCHIAFAEPYHLANRIVERSLDELVEPFRALHLKEEEIVLMKAIIILNPHVKTLSTDAAEQIADLRDRIQETLYHVVRESHPKEVASSRFGNILLFLPTIMILGNIMYENLQFAQSFGKQNVDPLLFELLDNLEPVDDHGAVNVDELLNGPSTSSLSHSMSSSSVSSLASQSSYCSQFSDDQQRHREYNGGAVQNHQQMRDSVVTNDVTMLNSTASMPNMRSAGQVNDSDPDYNVTLTAEMFTGMRQAMSVSQSMDTSMGMGTGGNNNTSGVHQTPPNSPTYMKPPPGYAMAPCSTTTVQQMQTSSNTTTTSRPQFYIEHPLSDQIVRRASFTLEPPGSKHKFTVTPNPPDTTAHHHAPGDNDAHSMYQSAGINILTKKSSSSSFGTSPHDLHLHDAVLQRNLQPHLLLNRTQPITPPALTSPQLQQPDFTAAAANLQQRRGSSSQQAQDALKAMLQQRMHAQQLHQPLPAVNSMPSMQQQQQQPTSTSANSPMTTASPITAQRHSSSSMYSGYSTANTTVDNSSPIDIHSMLMDTDDDDDRLPFY